MRGATQQLNEVGLKDNAMCPAMNGSANGMTLQRRPTVPLERSGWFRIEAPFYGIGFAKHNIACLLWP